MNETIDKPKTITITLDEYNELIAYKEEVNRLYKVFFDLNTKMKTQREEAEEKIANLETKVKITDLKLADLIVRTDFFSEMLKEDVVSNISDEETKSLFDFIISQRNKIKFENKTNLR